MQLELSFPDFWPDASPGCLPLGSGRKAVEFANVFVSVASVAVSLVPASIFWNPVEIKSLKYARVMAGIGHSHSMVCLVLLSIVLDIHTQTLHSCRLDGHRCLARLAPALVPRWRKQRQHHRTAARQFVEKLYLCER